jgi:phosphoribosylformylglycinamidine synthase
VALAEMAFAGGYGATLIMKAIPYAGVALRDDQLLFSESNSRFLVEVSAENKVAFEQVMKDVTCKVVGQVLDNQQLFYYGQKENLCLRADINELKDVWQKSLKF